METVQVGYADAPVASKKEKKNKESHTRIHYRRLRHTLSHDTQSLSIYRHRKGDKQQGENGEHYHMV